MGIIIIDKAKAPAQTENEPSRRTIDTYPTIPITIEGKPVKNIIEKSDCRRKYSITSIF